MVVAVQSFGIGRSITFGGGCPGGHLWKLMLDDLICGLLVVVEKVATDPSLPASLWLQSYPQLDCLRCESSFDLALGVVASLRSISRWLLLLRRNKGVRAFSCMVRRKHVVFGHLGFNVACGRDG